jgi:hypothetical protein
VRAKDKERLIIKAKADAEAELIRYAQLTIVRLKSIPRLDVFVELAQFPFDHFVHDESFIFSLKLLLIDAPDLRNIDAICGYMNGEIASHKVTKQKFVDLGVEFVPRLYVERNNPEHPELYGILMRKRGTNDEHA